VEQRALGRSGLVVSRLGLGTMTWGRDTDEDEAAMQLTAFVDAGGTLVDTADVYVDGESERTLGRLLADVVPRSDVLVATKAVGRTGPGPMRRGASRGHLLAALDASLERLDLDHVDLWQLHSWDPETPLEETLAACDTAVSSGRTRYVGVSNFTGWQTAQAATWQRSWPGRTPLVSTQMEYSLLQRGVEREVVPAAEALGLGVLPWSPLGRGCSPGSTGTTPPATRAARRPSGAGSSTDCVRPSPTGSSRR
jgi:aryl-alcohol dehydrogenase-like predicted oxidoreductase